MRWFNWLFNRFYKKAERLCQCGHWRCYHIDGSMSCNVYVPTPERPGAYCQCAQYIPAMESKAEKEIKELERMVRL